MRNGNNITWVDNEDYCRWKGFYVDPKGCLSLFGIENPEIEAEGLGYILIDGILFCSSPRVIVNLVRRKVRGAEPLISSNLIYGELGRSEPVIMADELALFKRIKRVKPYSHVNKLNIEGIREFVSDLDAHYDDFLEKYRMEKYQI